MLHAELRNATFDARLPYLDVSAAAVVRQDHDVLHAMQGKRRSSVDCFLYMWPFHLFYPTRDSNRRCF